MHSSQIVDRCSAGLDLLRRRTAAIMNDDGDSNPPLMATYKHLLDGRLDADDYQTTTTTTAAGASSR